MKKQYDNLIELGNSKGFDPVDENEINDVEALITDCIPTEKINYAEIFQLAKIGLQAINALEAFEPKEHNFTEFNATARLEYAETPKARYRVSFPNRALGRFYCFSDQHDAEVFYKGVCEGWEELHAMRREAK